MMSGDTIDLPEVSGDGFEAVHGMLSGRDIFIKEESGDVKNNDELMLLNEYVEDLTANPQYIGADRMISNGVSAFSPGQETRDVIGDFSKFPVELMLPCKAENNVKMERTHFIKYTVRDGKHMKIWECGLCSKEFGHQYTLMRHLPTHTDERKFRCNTCGKAFRQMSTLSQHRAIHSAERPYVCEVCNKTFNRVSTLISHRKTHTGLKPHKCHLCNKAFHQKGNLRNHIFTHTNERPYKCDVCGKGFNQMSNLMCHKLKAHQRIDKPRYSCRICGKDFPKRMALRNHEQYQHGVQGPLAIPVPDPPQLEQCPTIGLLGNPNPSPLAKVAAPNPRYTNGVLVEPIDTEAMKLAIRTNQTPFALLRPLNGIPVLVRVLSAGDKQMLVPATAEDLRKHGQITITATQNEPNTVTTTINGATQGGSTVQIKIPVVATVVQHCANDGTMSMAVQSPGPRGAQDDGYVIAAATEEERKNVLDGQMETAMEPTIEYIDEHGNVISEDEFKAKMEADKLANGGTICLSDDQSVPIPSVIDYEHSDFTLIEDNGFPQTINLEDTIQVPSDSITTSFQTENGEVYEIIDDGKPQNGLTDAANNSITMYNDANGVLEFDPQMIASINGFI